MQLVKYHNLPIERSWWRNCHHKMEKSKPMSEETTQHLSGTGKYWGLWVSRICQIKFSAKYVRQITKNVIQNSELLTSSALKIKKGLSRGIGKKQVQDHRLWRQTQLKSGRTRVEWGQDDEAQIDRVHQTNAIEKQRWENACSLKRNCDGAGCGNWENFLLQYKRTASCWRSRSFCNETLRSSTRTLYRGNDRVRTFGTTNRGVLSMAVIVWLSLERARIRTSDDFFVKPQNHQQHWR